MKASLAVLVCSLVALTTPLGAQAQLLWTLGLNDNGWPFNAQTPGDGGGPNASFVQEAGVNPPPGSPTSPEVDRSADDDYYFAGEYTLLPDTVAAFYGSYTPVQSVPVNEEATERAFAGDDNDERYHFNLPDTLLPTDLLSITFDMVNLDTGAANTDPRYGIEIYFNGVLVQTQIVIRPSQLGIAYTTPQFTLESVGAQVGAGYDNVVHLKGINYGGSGGGQWMGIDYVQLNNPTQPIPAPVFPWTVGLDDGGWPFNQNNPGNGGGSNATFVAEANVNALPGNPNSPETDRLADDDYYFAGVYSNTIPSVVALYGTYIPVGLVATNEEAVERAFAGDDNQLRYHFNLPNHLTPSDRVEVKFDAINLDTDNGGTPPFPTDPRYGVEVYFNGVLVQPQIVIRPAQLNQTITTPGFTLGSVNAAFGSGHDNIVTLKGINYGAEGGGQWMGIDYVQLDVSTNTIPAPTLPLQVGMDDDSWPVGDGGGTNATFVAGDGIARPLPGSPMNEEFDGDPDDDYYFAGAYTSVIAGNGNYVPVGSVYANEEAVARGFAGADNELRFHFNLPGVLASNDLLRVTFDALELGTGTDPRYGVEILFNGVLVQTQILIRPAQLGQPINSVPFSLGSVNAQVGPGVDNILTLRGINYNAQGGGDFLGFDYIRLGPSPRVIFPWMVGRDDNTHIREAGNGGGTNASFWQENGAINPLPGRPNNPEVDRQSDNDYYFAGVYTNTIESVVTLYGPYTPVGTVAVNEEGAERAFAAADNDLRYHFNLPDTLQPTDLLSVTFDPLNLHERNDIPGGVYVVPDPRYGVEIYFNGVLVQTQLVIRPSGLNVPYTSPEFSLASVNAQTGVGFDNIVSLKGINYDRPDGDPTDGGNWMGIDYVALNHVVTEQPQFQAPTVSGGNITLNWTGSGVLEWAPAITGAWTEIQGAASGYSEAIVPGQMRFYRIRNP
jgi:hypothetical protein